MPLKLKLRRLVPAQVMSRYHWCVSWFWALWYGLPARRLVVIGVTGTKGKSTTCAMVRHILQSVGYKVGLVSTAQFAIGDEVWLNDLKMTMPGRKVLQVLLRRMVAAGCSHVVLETSSEGLAQWRHAGIQYDVAVFTNLAPEHLESHGGYQQYREAKGKLFASMVGLKPKSVAWNGKVLRIEPTSVLNLDDAEVSYFLSFPVSQRFGFTLHDHTLPQLSQQFSVHIHSINAHQADFSVNGQVAQLPVGGEFNVANAAAAATACVAVQIKLADALRALNSFSGTPGRLEFIDHGQPFEVVVDYAHTPESLEALYKTLQGAGGGLVAVLGSCGGGRDKAKRAPLGRLAGRYARLVIVTDEDPYDEDAGSIRRVVAEGAREVGKREDVDLLNIADRRQAIARALTEARPGETVVVTGKGSEQWMCVEGGRKIPWDDRQVVEAKLAKLQTE